MADISPAGNGGSGQTPTPIPRVLKYGPKYVPSEVSVSDHPYFDKSMVSVVQANRVILLTVGGSVAVVLLARLSGSVDKQNATITLPFFPRSRLPNLNDPGALLRIGIGATVTILALLVVAESEPELAEKFGWLILLGTVLVYGRGMSMTLNQALKHPTITKSFSKMTDKEKIAAQPHPSASSK